MQALTPGELTRREAIADATGVSDASLAEAVDALVAVVPELSIVDEHLLLSAELKLIDSARFERALTAHSARIHKASLYALCESTNSAVLTQPFAQNGSVNLALAEFQTSGRGRQGRKWTSGFAGGICLTVAQQFKQPVASTITLAVGVCVAEVLDSLLTDRVLLKWPNDLLMGGGKVGGILVESTLQGSTCTLRVGVGVNCVAPDAPAHSDGLPALRPVALNDFVDPPVDRTQLAASLVQGVLAAMDEHAAEGFAAFVSRWQDRDYLYHQPVQVFDQEHVRHGTAIGINAQGELCVRTEEGDRWLGSGDVRVRKRL